MPQNRWRKFCRCTMYGHTVEMAHTGRDALNAARRSRPNLVLMDLAMPEMDGHQVAALIRREPSLDLTLLVAVTGGSRNEDQRAAND